MVIKSQLWKLGQKCYNGHVAISYRLHKWLDYLNSNPWHLLERHLVRKVACGGGEDPKRVERTLECGISSKKVRWQEEGRGLAVWGKMWGREQEKLCNCGSVARETTVHILSGGLHFLSRPQSNKSLPVGNLCSNLYLLRSGYKITMRFGTIDPSLVNSMAMWGSIKYQANEYWYWIQEHNWKYVKQNYASV